MVQYYTLREAAEKLRMDPEKLKEMAKNNQLRAFQDRGNLRFRAQEIDEMARSLGLGSDPDLPLADLLPPKSAPKPPASGKSPPPSSKSGKSPPPSSRRTMHVPADAEMSLVGDDIVPIGEEPPSSRGKGSSKSKLGSGKKSGSSPSPVPAHDSDVRLIADGSDLDFQLEVGDDQPKAPASPSPKKRPSKLGPDGKPDSGVRIVPLDQASDSDVKIVPDDRADADVVLGGGKSKTPSDSDVRLEQVAPPPGRGGHDPFVTEEIELDLESLKEEEAKAKRRKPTKSSPELPTHSPFELSEDDAGPAKGAKNKKKPAKDLADDSSDFELTPLGAGDESPIELGSAELPIPLAKDDDEDVVLGDIGAPGQHKSGINLRDPKDSGISLEEGGSEEIEFTAMTGGSATPKPGSTTPKPAPGHDSSGEFELSMDDSSPLNEEEEHTSSEFELSLDPGTGEEDSSSEFELSLDPGATTESPSAVGLEEGAEDSDSEFELSLDASGELESDDDASLSEDEKDIFETDFEVPALDDESASEAVALDEGDTDLEDSDFELDLSDEELAGEEESGSQVVALEDEEEASGEVEVDEDAPVSRKPRKKAPSGELDGDTDAPLIDLDDMEGEAEAEIDAGEEAAVGAAAAPPAPWGIVPVLALAPAFLVLIFVVIMSFEMLNTMWGYHTGGTGAHLIIDPLARGMIDDKIP